MLDTVGCSRGVLVQGSAHGRDNGAMLDALARAPERLRGVAVADADVSPAELRRWHALGVRGPRFNHFFRGGALHRVSDQQQHDLQSSGSARLAQADAASISSQARHRGSRSF
jgi:predicted TIM-barrel fold metal-dependent hydrolase